MRGRASPRPCHLLAQVREMGTGHQQLVDLPLAVALYLLEWLQLCEYVEVALVSRQHHTLIRRYFELGTHFAGETSIFEQCVKYQCESGLISILKSSQNIATTTTTATTRRVQYFHQELYSQGIDTDILAANVSTLRSIKGCLSTAQHVALLQHCTKLESLEVFLHPELDRALLVPTISRLDTLTELSINGWWAETDGPALSSLLSAISSFCFLRRLNIQASDSDITGFVHLTRVTSLMELHIPSLERLSIPVFCALKTLFSQLTALHIIGVRHTYHHEVIASEALAKEEQNVCHFPFLKKLHLSTLTGVRIDAPLLELWESEVMEISKHTTTQKTKRLLSLLSRYPHLRRLSFRWLRSPAEREDDDDDIDHKDDQSVSSAAEKEAEKEEKEERGMQQQSLLTTLPRWLEKIYFSFSVPSALWPLLPCFAPSLTELELQSADVGYLVLANTIACLTSLQTLCIINRKTRPMWEYDLSPLPPPPLPQERAILSRCTTIKVDDSIVLSKIAQRVAFPHLQFLEHCEWTILEETNALLSQVPNLRLVTHFLPPTKSITCLLTTMALLPWRVTSLTLKMLSSSLEEETLLKGLLAMCAPTLRHLTLQSWGKFFLPSVASCLPPHLTRLNIQFGVMCHHHPHREEISSCPKCICDFVAILLQQCPKLQSLMLPHHEQMNPQVQREVAHLLAAHTRSDLFVFGHELA